MTEQTQPPIANPLGDTEAAIDGLRTPPPDGGDLGTEEQSPPKQLLYKRLIPLHEGDLGTEEHSTPNQLLSNGPAPRPKSGLTRQRFAERFQLVRLLGEGGMGAVYLAKDTRIGRHVAIKTLRPHQTQGQRWLQAFRREATAIGRLSHPHILTLYDFGVDEGVPFMVLEYLKGKPLDALVSKGPMPMGQVVKLAQQTAMALQHAHERDIIHRDLKPSNL
ncbi:MAG: serine/threonine-protein kinase, partial [Myxococcota bacterium]